MKVEILLVILKIKYEFLAIVFPGKREIRIEYSFLEFFFSKMTPKKKSSQKEIIVPYGTFSHLIIIFILR